MQSDYSRVRFSRTRNNRVAVLCDTSGMPSRDRDRLRLSLNFAFRELRCVARIQVPVPGSRSNKLFFVEPEDGIKLDDVIRALKNAVDKLSAPKKSEANYRTRDRQQTIRRRPDRGHAVFVR